jgi:methionine synthase I (cobalamin-dependent)
VRFDATSLAARVAVADGAWSTQLAIRGLPPNVVAESANVRYPELVLELSQAYLDAGARILSTNTFAGNRVALAQRRVREDPAAWNRRGVELAREAAAGADVLIVGAMGPSGRLLRVPDAERDELAAGFRAHARELAEAGVDALLLETFTELAELLLAVQTVKDATGLPVIASMSYDSGPQRTATHMGDAAEQAGAALDELGADVIGCNCGSGAATTLPAVVALRAATRRALWVKPGAGPPEWEEGRLRYHLAPDDFAHAAAAWIDAGANIIGGCCGIGPEHIRKVSGLVGRRRR